MAFWSVSKVKRLSLVLAVACLSALVAAGCDDRVQITRDPDVRIARGATWAWQPVTEPVAARDSRRVTSRDTMGRNEPAARDVTGDNQLVRDRVKTAIQQSLMAKGLSQVSDPATADFLVDYHFAVERRSATVQTVYPGAYPGLVCGPYRCWEGWGYGPSAVGYERVHFREGTIVFDFTQQSTKHLVYRATGQKPVRRDTFSLTQDEINGLVNHLLKDLKARK
jgi:Domain of unknown function (DUF4136)